jgi:hypothetical protein
VADTAALFLDSKRRPRLRRCAVLFLDLLGVGDMARGPDAGEHLLAISRAVSGSYRDFLSAESPWPAALFSDTLVLAAPIVGPSREAAAVLGLVEQAALLELELVAQGLFARGGLAVGEFHIHNGLIFGGALVDAYQLESQGAVHPRIVLADAAVECLRGAPEAQEASLLLCDADGRSFVDYLSRLFDEPADPRPRLRAHRKAVVDKLVLHAGERRRWEKYRWVAEYHNAVTADRLPREARLRIAPQHLGSKFQSFPAGCAAGTDHTASGPRQTP